MKVELPEDIGRGKDRDTTYEAGREEKLFQWIMRKVSSIPVITFSFTFTNLFYVSKF